MAVLDASGRETYTARMHQPHAQPSPASMPHQEIYADRALLMMRTLSVSPTPRHYSIFYACAGGQPTELVREIEKIVTAKQPVTDALLDTLYATYIAESSARTVQDSAANVKQILNDMMDTVTTFTEDTHAVGKNVAAKLQEFEKSTHQHAVRDLAASLVEGAVSFENSSKNMTVNLAGAQQEIQQLRETLARVETEAERDFLTGCYNRRAFDKRLREATAEAIQTKTELSLVMLDIDFFKKFNDTHGHLVGDEVLKTVAKALNDTLKGSDTVARYGGEEFAVLLPRTPIKGALTVAELLRNSIANKELKRKSTGEVFGRVTVSMGATVFHPDEDVSSFIERADKGLYESKKTGRNKVTAA